jgi:hypothetical protein
VTGELGGTGMTGNTISVIDLAVQLGKRKQTIFKVIRRLGIEPTKATSNNSRGAFVAYVTDEEARLIRTELATRSNSEAFGEFGLDLNETAVPGQQGLFYLILLEPDQDPGRFKVGFAINLSDRLRALRCSAPFATVVKSWPCKMLWEKTAIECVSDGCERLHTEVFRADSIEAVISKCESFFALMPSLSR